MEKYTSTKTIFGAYLEAARRAGTAFEVIDNSTLNQYFGVLSGTTSSDDTTYPDTAYFAIGRGGHEVVTGTDSTALLDIKRHRITNPRCFTHLPFIMREVDDDLSSTKITNYGMRVLETYDGTSYFSYYLKRIDAATDSPTITELTVDSGETTTSEYTQTETMLTDPQEVSSDNNVVNSSSGTYLAVTSPLPIELDADDIDEIIAACEIIYSDSRYAELSEIAIVSGIDYSTTSTDGGVSVTYDEVIEAQVYTFISTYVNLNYQSDGVTMNFKIGSTLNYLT